MTKGSKIILIVLGFFVCITISASYYRFIVIHDYIIEAEVDCDPTSESCFVWQCDPTVDECTGNEEDDTWYFKYAYRNAQFIPKCTDDETCDQFTCSSTEDDCREVQCSDEALAVYEITGQCTSPESFIMLESEETEDVTLIEN